MPHLVGAVLRFIEGRPWNNTIFPLRTIDRTQEL
jgi:hypothetical protein